ncbi:L,D-transpeptidase [Pseudahrensia aquimaris]|uniref:L,D-transpeptidase n=1 Tax=Pseudahrensia aquimaris TaxID=744461 RepID=A0ABW3FKA6_9HYPH
MQRTDHVCNTPFRQLIVRKRPGHETQGFLQAGGRVLRCALGRGGLGSIKREGDGKTPIGRFVLLDVYARPDAGFQNVSALPQALIGPNDGWCDAVGDRNYNRRVKLPYPASHERLLRDDHLYDVFIVIDHNITRRMTRGGSAIFFHLAHDDYRPTEGCIAISRADMHWLLPRINGRTVMVVG